MAGATLFTLLDDIATILDDVATMTKVATKKTAGVLGDDLALNAQQVAGVSPERELPVVWAVAKGSVWNKVILVPAALAISAFLPWLILPLLMIGGAFLCYEGCEKLLHKFLHSKAEDEARHQELISAIADPNVDILAQEREKIRGAIRTDFILSAEIVTIALGTVATAAFSRQVAVLVSIALIMTIGVYGLVACIVKLDDLGLRLTRSSTGRAKRALGTAILKLAPYLMKGLSIAGTVAMFMVGGSILTHGLPAVHHGILAIAEAGRLVPGVGGLLGTLLPLLGDVVVGLFTGAAVVVIVLGIKKLAPRRTC